MTRHAYVCNDAVDGEDADEDDVSKITIEVLARAYSRHLVSKLSLICSKTFCCPVFFGFRVHATTRLFNKLKSIIQSLNHSIMLSILLASESVVTNAGFSNPRRDEQAGALGA